MAERLGLSAEELQAAPWPEVLAGNRLLKGMVPYAARYGGHQFGNWAGQLGDGRAITLGEVINCSGERWELQLKGAGPTPYSRTADGRAVLRSSVREFLCSEAMHHLGVPTTRALSLAVTGEDVLRDMFYDGHPETEPGAVVCRVAPSFLRFGNFEILAALEEHALLRQLFDYAVETHFPELDAQAPEVVAQFLEEVSRRTAVMISHWMRVGFVHGVMNTDNMSILGLTIDYGPYGWLEDFDPDWTPNTTDAGSRRYRFANQPQIAFWNLAKLASALAPLVDDVAILEPALATYRATLQAEWSRTMAQKLGLAALDLSSASGSAPTRDDELLNGHFQTLQLVETDMTIFYRCLADLTSDHSLGSGNANEVLVAPIAQAFYQPEQVTGDTLDGIASWLRTYLARCREDPLSGAERRRVMSSANPRYVLRNYMAQLAIDDAVEHLEEGVAPVAEELPRPPPKAVRRAAWAGAVVCPAARVGAVPPRLLDALL